MRFCVGAHVSDQMQIPRTAHRHVLPALSPVFLAGSLARRRPGYDQAARCARVLDSFRPVTTVPRGEGALVAGEQVSADIATRAGARPADPRGALRAR
jgi:hypothetical protein